MRQIHRQSSGEASGRRIREPLAEGVERKRKYYKDAEIVHIIKMRTGLEKEGLTDGQIAEKIGAEINRSAGSVNSKIRRLVRSGHSEENPNGPEKFSDDEIALIMRRRAELEKEGLNDKQTAKRIAWEVGRSIISVELKIRRLVRSGRLAENANKEKLFSEDEIAFIVRMRAGLEKEGMRDEQIAKRIAAEIGRSVGSVKEKIRKLVRDGMLARNEHKLEMREFGEWDIALIVRRRAELEKAGLNDEQVGNKIAREMGRSSGSLKSKLHHLVQSGRLARNWHYIEQKKFGEEDIAFVIRRRAELEKEGMTDHAVAEKIAREMGRIAKSVAQKLRELVHDGRLAENANKRDVREFSEEEIALMMARRAELEGDGMNDRQIAGRVAGEIGRSAGSLREKIRALVDEGRLAKNRNKREKKPRGFFTGMSDGHLMEYARNEMGLNGIGSRIELKKLDNGLYQALLGRNLLDAIFAEVEAGKRDAVLGQLREAMGLYTGEKT